MHWARSHGLPGAGWATSSRVNHSQLVKGAMLALIDSYYESVVEADPSRRPFREAEMPERSLLLDVAAFTPHTWLLLHQRPKISSKAAQSDVKNTTRVLLGVEMEELSPTQDRSTAFVFPAALEQSTVIGPLLQRSVLRIAGILNPSSPLGGSASKSCESKRWCENRRVRTTAAGTWNGNPCGD